MGFDFSLVDLFTDRPFGGNWLAVFPHATGIADATLAGWCSASSSTPSGWVRSSLRERSPCWPGSRRNTPDRPPGCCLPCSRSATPWAWRRSGSCLTGARRWYAARLPSARPVSRCRGVCTTDRPDDPPAGSCRGSRKRRGEAAGGVVRFGGARGVRRSRSPPPRARVNVRVSGTHGTPANRGTQPGGTLAGVFAGWRAGLWGPVIVVQAGTAVSYFGTGLVLPFEIIYLHRARGFPAATGGLVLAAVMGTAAAVTPLSGALLDRFRAKPILITGNLGERAGLRGLRLRRPSLARLRLRGRRRRRVRSRDHRDPGSEPDPGLGGAAGLLGRAAPGRRQLRSWQRRDGGGLHRRCRR